MSSKDIPTISIEFFPPRSSEAELKLDAVHQQLAALSPDFFSVTYGAAGSTKDGTQEIVLRYQALGSKVAPHLSFGGTSEDEVLRLLNSYRDAGIDRLVALRGDVQQGRDGKIGHRYANELVEFIRQHTGDHFHIEVACYPEMHPEAKNFSEDIAYFKQKVDAGADSAITQYFFNVDAYFRFLDQCAAAGINLPIVPGIMPITNYENLARFSNKCGAEIPRWLAKRLQDFGDDKQSLREFGLDVVTELCERLLAGGAPGLHFYSLNLSRSVTSLWQNLDLASRRQAR